MRTLPLFFLAACGLTQVDVDDSIATHAGDPEAHHATVVPGVDQAAVDQAVDDHAADPSAHHTKTTDASELTSGVLDPARLPEVEIQDLPIRERTLSVNLFGAYLVNGATFGSGGFGNTAIQLPDVGTPSLALQFTVPDDFVGDTITLRVGWRTASTACTFMLLPDSVDRFRPGSSPGTGSATSGFTGPLVPLTASATARVGELAEYTVALGGGYADIQPGDGLALRLYRNASNASDTCTSALNVTSLSLAYDAQ